MSVFSVSHIYCINKFVTPPKINPIEETLDFCLLLCGKGQLISKAFVVFNFFKKTNKNTSHSSKNEFICLFFEEFTA